jgi:hypothetical protein
LWGFGFFVGVSYTKSSSSSKLAVRFLALRSYLDLRPSDTSDRAPDIIRRHALESHVLDVGFLVPDLSSTNGGFYIVGLLLSAGCLGDRLQLMHPGSLVDALPAFHFSLARRNDSLEHLKLLPFRGAKPGNCGSDRGCLLKTGPIPVYHSLICSLVS